MSVAILIKLDDALNDAGVTKNALAREAKVRPNLIYEMCEGKTKRIDLETLSNILDTLNSMTGRQYTLTDVLEYMPQQKEDR
ncbi:helix-turn-helix transcriptional regulator [Cytobacillus firmus]|nr:helix-turn-helix transcriptional regulator [Cytobacillus firmus]